MLIDCGTCRGHTQGRCGDCVVTVLGTLPRPRVSPPPPAAERDAQRSPRRAGPMSEVIRRAADDATLGGAGSAGPPEPTSDQAGLGWLPLDHQEQVAVDLFVRVGLVDADEAAHLQAWPATWQRHRAVG